MIIDAQKLSGPCTCGKVHNMVTQRAIIEAGCMKDFDMLMATAGLNGRRTAIYDTNTYYAKGMIRPDAQQEVILPAEVLIADDGAVASVLSQLRADTEILIAVGSGTIHDIVRYCAHRLGLAFVSCPTAASMDGYTSSLSAMCWQGAPVILPGVAPVLVIADTDVIASAPQHLVRGGMGDAISKYTALADWKIDCLLHGKTPCPLVETTLRQAAVAAQGACEGLQKQDTGAYAQLMYALILSGLACQMTGEAEPSCGAEHQLSYLMDLQPDAYGANRQLLHGEKAGLCAVVVADLYHRLAAIDDIAPYLKPYKAVEQSDLAKAFGEPLADRIMQENTPDCLKGVNPADFAAHWAEIQHILLELPSAESLSAMLASVGAPATMESVGVGQAKMGKMLQLSPYLRNQFTLVRMLRMLKFRYASQPGTARQGRYGEKRQPSRVGKETKKAVSLAR